MHGYCMNMTLCWTDDVKRYTASPERRAHGNSFYRKLGIQYDINTTSSKVFTSDDNPKAIPEVLGDGCLGR